MSPHPVSDERYRKYTACFLFKGKPNARQVLLVRKTHPKWQAGMMNAVGGEFEKGEDATACVVREMKEETGWNLMAWSFNLFCSEYGPGYEVHFFRAFLPEDVSTKDIDWKTNDKGEDLEWCSAYQPKYPVIGNLNWLLPLALDPRPFTCVVRTEGDIRKLVTW